MATEQNCGQLYYPEVINLTLNGVNLIKICGFGSRYLANKIRGEILRKMC